MLNTNSRRVGVFIDVQNMYYSARNLFNKKVNFENIVKDVVGDAQLVRAMAYTISTKGGEEEPFFEALRKSGIEVVSKDLLEYSGGNKKGDWDVGLAIDIVRSIEMLDVIVLVSGDGDFVPLTDFVRSRGRIMHVASFRESTSTSLVESADIYTNFSDEKRKFLIGGRPAAKRAAAKKGKTVSKTTKAKAKPKTKAVKVEDKAEVDYFKTHEVKSTDENDTSRTRRLTF